MALEIERKFLVHHHLWQPLDEGLFYCQGYIYTYNGTTVRVRIAGNQGYLTIKGKARGISRDEFEYTIPLEEAQDMLQNLCDRPLIEKIRYKVREKGLIWEIDRFLGDNQGLILAEVELEEESQTVIFPTWVDVEVTNDARYYNSNLAKNPYTKWN